MSIEAKADSISSVASYTTNGTIFVFGALTLNHLIALSAAFLAIATFGVNFYFQRRRDAREQEFHEKRMSVKERTEEVVSRLPDVQPETND